MKFNEKCENNKLVIVLLHQTVGLYSCKTHQLPKRIAELKNDSTKFGRCMHVHWLRLCICVRCKKGKTSFKTPKSREIATNLLSGSQTNCNGKCDEMCQFKWKSYTILVSMNEFSRYKYQSRTICVYTVHEMWAILTVEILEVWIMCSVLFSQ